MNEYDEVAGGDASVGQRLRQAREERGLTLDDVATQTRIPIRHLRNIEDSNWDELPAVTYTIGFARNYANAVGLDGIEIGRELREQLGGGTARHQISPDVYAPPDPARVPSRPLAWIAGLIAIVLVVGYLWWRSRLDSDTQVAQTPPPAEQQATQPPPQQPAQPQPPANLAGQPLVLVASETVWLRISDGRNSVTTTTLQAGSRLPIPQGLQQPRLSTHRPHVLHLLAGDRDLGPLGDREGNVSISLAPADLAQRLQGQAATTGATPPQPAGNGFQPML